MGGLSLLQEIFPTQGLNLGLPQLQANSLPAEPQGKTKNTGVGSLCLLQGNLPDAGIKPGSPALQEDSLPTELSGKPHVHMQMLIGVVGTWRTTFVIALECFKNPSKEVGASCLPPSRAEKKGKAKKPFGLHLERKRVQALRRPRQGLSLGI